MVIIQTNLIIIVINKRYLINKIDETNELSPVFVMRYPNRGRPNR